MHNFWVLILGKGTAQKGWNNGMETYHSLQLDSLLQTYWFHVLKNKFKPLSQPQSLKFLELLLNIESRRKKKKKNTIFFLLSQAYQSQDLFHHYGNMFEINKGWFLKGLKYAVKSC